MARVCKCGVQAAEGDQFCGGCGERLAAPAPRRGWAGVLVAGLVVAGAMAYLHVPAAPAPPPVATGTPPPTPPPTVVPPAVVPPTVLPTPPPLATVAPPLATPVRRTLAQELDDQVVFGCTTRKVRRGQVEWTIWCKSEPAVAAQIRSVSYDIAGRRFEVGSHEKLRHQAGAKLAFRRTTWFVDGSFTTDEQTLEASR